MFQRCGRNQRPGKGSELGSIRGGASSPCKALPLTPGPLLCSDSRIVFASWRLGRFHPLQSLGRLFGLFVQERHNEKSIWVIKVISCSTRQKSYIYIHMGPRPSLVTLAMAASRRTPPNREGQRWGPQGLWQVPLGKQGAFLAASWQPCWTTSTSLLWKPLLEIYRRGFSPPTTPSTCFS